jgi:hypothetical protein
MKTAGRLFLGTLGVLAILVAVALVAVAIVTGVNAALTRML